MDQNGRSRHRKERGSRAKEEKKKVIGLDNECDLAVLEEGAGFLVFPKEALGFSPVL